MCPRRQGLTEKVKKEIDEYRLLRLYTLRRVKEKESDSRHRPALVAQGKRTRFLNLNKKEDEKNEYRRVSAGPSVRVRHEQSRDDALVRAETTEYELFTLTQKRMLSHL